MAREEIDLYNVGALDSVENLAKALSLLRADFDAHNHDGSSSRQLENIIARTLQVQSAIIGGYKLFQATVGPTQSDFKTVAEALKAGKTRIFVRNGTYLSEPKWTISNANTVIVGESYGGVSITFAEDTANHRSISTTAANAKFANLKLTAYSTTASDLFYFNGQYPLVEDCILVNINGKIFNSAYGANLHATLRNLLISVTTVTDAANYRSFVSISGSLIQNVIINHAGIGTENLIIADSCSKSIFANLRFLRTANGTSKITTCEDSYFLNSYFYLQELASMQSNFDACILENNTYIPGSFLALDSAFGRLNNCKVIVGTGNTVLTASASSIQIHNNFFRGGSAITIQNASINIQGNSFSGNNWVTDYDTTAPTLLLGTGTRNGLCVNNILRNNASGGANTPVITDSGTGNTVANNKLILA